MIQIEEDRYEAMQQELAELREFKRVATEAFDMAMANIQNGLRGALESATIWRQSIEVHMQEYRKVKGTQ